MWERAGGFTGGQTGPNTPEEGQLNMSLCLYTGLGRDGPYQTGHIEEEAQDPLTAHNLPILLLSPVSFPFDS